MARQFTGFAIDVSFTPAQGGSGAFDETVFYCTTVQEPGQAAGDDIDVTTNKSRGYKEYKPADLREPSEFSVTAAWDPTNRELLEAATNAGMGTVKIVYNECTNRAEAHTTTLDNCWLKSWEPGEMTIGEMPTVSLTFGYAPGSGSGA